MLRAVNYCGLRIEYKLTKKEVKNINIRITENGEISVSAPIKMSSRKVDEFVEKKAEWIFRKMADVEKRRELLLEIDDELYDGKVLYYLGKEYSAKLINGKKFEVERTEDEIIISSRQGDENLKSKYINWLIKEAKPVFNDSVDRMLKLMDNYNIAKPEIYIRNMKKRWGSCNMQKHKIGLNVQLMKANIKCIDKVVLHELVHFVHYDHSSNFYGLLDELMPDWRERKEELETNYFDGIM